MINKLACTGLVLRFAFLLLLTSSTIIAGSQVKGTVYDAEKNTPLSNVLVKCGQDESITDKNGAFSLKTSGLLVINNFGYMAYSQIVDDSVFSLKIYLVLENVNIKEVVVRGPLQQSQLYNLPASVSILRKSDLDQSWSVSYVEQLNQLSGVYAHTGALNTNRITIRGIGSRTPYGTNRVRAYYNEIPLTSADGTTNIEDIDQTLLNSIDVLKGPKSAVYGAGLGGVILLSDKKHLQDGFHGKVTPEAGMFDTYKPALELSYKKKAFSVSSFYSNTQSEGFRENSAYDRHSIQVKLAYKGKRIETSLLLHYVDLKAFIPSSLNKETFKNSPEQAAGNWLAVKGFEEYYKLLVGLRNNFIINSKWTNKTIVYANLSDAYESRPFNVLDDNNQRLGVKNYLNYSAGNWRVQVGFEIVDEKYNWDIFETNDGRQGQLLNRYSEKRNSGALFADLKWQSKNGWIIESGISYNFQYYQLEDLLPGTVDRSGSYQYQSIPAPFIGVNLPIIRNLRFYGSYSYGFSYPTVEETLLPDGQINNELRPETGNSFELGYRLSAFDNNLYLDVGAYLLLVDNLLVTDRISEDIFTGKNAGSTRHSGFEFSAVALLNKKENYHLPSVKINIALTVAENTFTDFVDDGVDYKGKTLPGVPNFTMSTSVELNYSKGLYFSFKTQNTGKQFLDDSNTASYLSYHLAHLKTGYKWKLKKNQVLSFYLGVNNVFDEKYASMLLVNAPSFGGAAPRYYYPGQPRYLFGGVGLRF